MLTKVTAYSQWTTVDPLVLNVVDRPETDLFEVRNIDGLGAVKADVNTTPLGSIAGESFNGTNVGKRNLVFTLGLTPDWNVWTMSKLRQLLDKYFMPQQTIRLVFEGTEFSPVEIFGYIESNEPNMFSKDPEQQISIICPKLYFRSVAPVVITGQSTDLPIEIEYEGNVEAGIHLAATKASGADPTYIGVRINDSFIFAELTGFGSPVDDNRDFELSTIPGEKYIRSIIIPDGTIINLLNFAQVGVRWPLVSPGALSFDVESSAGIQDWTLTYYPLFGSL